ncbi:MAG: hypothetical protein WAU20_14750 [Dokdonella sp.]
MLAFLREPRAFAGAGLPVGGGVFRAGLRWVAFFAGEGSLRLDAGLEVFLPGDFFVAADFLAASLRGATLSAVDFIFAVGFAARFVATFLAGDCLLTAFPAAVPVVADLATFFSATLLFAGVFLVAVLRAVVGLLVAAFFVAVFPAGPALAVFLTAAFLRTLFPVDAVFALGAVFLVAFFVAMMSP